MDYFEYNGQQSKRGVLLSELITSKIVDILSGMDNIKNKNTYLLNLFYDLCLNESLLYRVHKEYCEKYEVYSEKCRDIPHSPKLRNQIFQIMTSVLNYEITKYKIMNNIK